MGTIYIDLIKITVMEPTGSVKYRVESRTAHCTVLEHENTVVKAVTKLGHKRITALALLPRLPQDSGRSLNEHVTTRQGSSGVGGLHNAMQSSVPNTHPGIWKLIPLLMEEETFVKEAKL